MCSRVGETKRAPDSTRDVSLYIRLRMYVHSSTVHVVTAKIAYISVRVRSCLDVHSYIHTYSHSVGVAFGEREREREREREVEREERALDNP